MDYQKSLMKDLELKPPDSKKLLLTLEDKNNLCITEAKAYAQGAVAQTRMLDGVRHPDE